jgi:hypothetical protein
MKTLGVAAVVALALATAGCGSKPVATADDAVKACRSSDYAPGAENIGSSSTNYPDGIWLVEPNTTYTVKLTVKSPTDSKYNQWTCTTGMDSNGTWTVDWAIDALKSTRPVYPPPTATPTPAPTQHMPTWSITSKELRTLRMPRDLSGPGHVVPSP